MGFFERAIRRGISEGVGNAIGKAVQDTLAPKASELADKAARHIDQATASTRASARKSYESSGLGGLESAFANLERAAQGYATEVGKNIKVCPSCGQPAKAEAQFCPSCSARLPEQTMAQGAVCTQCGTQNSVGTTYCQSCGAILPAAVQEREAAAARDAAAMAQWDQQLWAYPKWNCGGCRFEIEQHDYEQFSFSASFEGDEYGARNAVRRYRDVLQQNGFRPAGQYPSQEHLYKMVEGACYHVDTEHCFEGDPDCPTVYFLVGEPRGGFDYVKPEPKKPKSFRDLLGF